MLLYLAPLPICLAGLGWGWTSAATAALVGTLLLGGVFGASVGAIFAGTIAIPITTLCYLALLSRLPAAPQGQATGALEWYPIGRLVGWAAIIAGAIVSLGILMTGYNADSLGESMRELFKQGAFKDLDPNGTLINESSIGGLSNVLVWLFPAFSAILWQSIALFNLWLAGVIIETSERALRPWPKLDAIELPNAFFLAFTASLIAAFLPGTAGLVAIAFAGALFLAYVLQGLAVLHAFSRGMPFRGLLLAAVYIGIVLLAWPAIAVVILGLAEPMLRLRERAAARGQPPSPPD
ncbi:DUF2232 domain-containing protein [Methyloceanibacter sp.]|uniref:DUF2232 domain-containing protein n=1 Tax=Methyloceanibacter sp. TaxID=1965321 RepID=UPI003D6D5D8A